MTKPEKRWQLLLVADDGRIIPFKRFKGMAITLLIALVVVGLVCAGLGWQLKREITRHRQTLAQLDVAKRQAAQYKSENEIVTAELVLAEARMEKAGLPVPKRKPTNSNQKTEETAADTEPTATTLADAQEQAKPASAKQSTPSQPDSQSKDIARSASPQKVLAAKTPPDNPPVVALGELEIDHNAAKRSLTATFRVSNTGPRSSPVHGRCLLVLKTDPADAHTWQGLPDGAVVDGKLDPQKGKNFKISRFIDMDLQATVGSDPSSITTATVYIYDDAGSIMLEKDFAIALKSGPSAADVSVGGDAEELAVGLSRFEMQHDTANHTLRATFRVSNDDPRASSVAGRCVVVIKNEQMQPETWLALPDGAIIGGRPDKHRGQSFRISRFINIDMKTTLTTDPSVFNRAIVYVFDMDGALLLEKAYPIRLPAPDPKPTPTAKTPIKALPAADEAAVPPTDDASPGKGSDPQKEDGRSRF